MVSPGTAGYKLLEIIALSGEFPVTALDQFIGEGRYKEKIITQLKAESIIKTYYRDGVRAFRLTQAGKKYLMQQDPARYSQVLQMQPSLKSDLSHRSRLHKMCEVLITVSQSNAAIFPDKKPLLFSENPYVDSYPVYYSSREIKIKGTDTVKIRNARFCGVLLTRANLYLVYHAGKTCMRWDRISEIKARAMAVQVIGKEWLSGQYPMRMVQGIVLGSNMESCYRLMTGTPKNTTRSFYLDQTFDHLHFIPRDAHSNLLLQLLYREEIATQLRGILLRDLQPADPQATMENDGFEQEIPVLLAYDGDMQRLANFVQALRLQNRKGIGFCFDFQKEVLHRYCGDCVDFRTIDTDKFQKRFSIGGTKL